MDLRKFIDEIDARYTFYGDSVYILQDEAPDKIGLIEVPDEARPRPIVGTVVAVGIGVDFEGDHSAARGLTVGDRAIFHKFAPTKIGLTRLDGDVVDVIRVHVNNLYVGWRE